MRKCYVSLYTWEWQPIGQVTVDLSLFERNGKIDRAELDDAAHKAARPLLRGIKDVHVFLHEGAPATPGQLREAAMQDHARRGDDATSWTNARRTRKPSPIVRSLLEERELKK